MEKRMEPGKRRKLFTFSRQCKQHKSWDTRLGDEVFESTDQKTIKNQETEQ